MTKTQQLIESARLALGGATDYRLAKELEIARPRMSYYVRGMEQADAYACVKLAIVLNRDPLEVIAEVEAESARTPAKREFWSRFPSGLRRTALGVGLSAIFATSAGAPRIGEAASPEPTTHNGRLRPKQNQKMLKTRRPEGRFFLAAGLAHARRKSRSSATKNAWHSPRSFFLLPPPPCGRV